MKKPLAFLVILSLPYFSNAQFGNLLKKAKGKITQRADSRVDATMDKKLDDLEGEKSNGSSDNTTAEGKAQNRRVEFAKM